MESLTSSSHSLNGLGGEHFQIINSAVASSSSTSGPTIVSIGNNNNSKFLSPTSKFSLFSNGNNTVQAQAQNGSKAAGIKRKKQDSKTGKGLRHFSMKVCEKVRNKGTTTYNEVADELVAEISSESMSGRASFNGNDQEPFDQKNIRRRVYDALNVLMAINIISKEKKEIKWIGLPTNAQQECSDLEQERRERLERITKKKQQLREMMIQQIAFKALIQRNKNTEISDPNAVIKLPFIIVNTDSKTLVDCSISRDRCEYLFNFSNTFEIHDDVEVLKRMNLSMNLDKLEHGQTMKRSDVHQIKEFLSEALRPELDEMLEEKHIQLVN